MDEAIIPSVAAARLPRSATILVRTDIETNFAFIVSEEDTVGELKRKIITEHANIHPALGNIKILSLKMKWGKSLFSLSDSMSVRDAFCWAKGAWIVYVDTVSTAPTRNMVATSTDYPMVSNGDTAIGRSKSPDSQHHQHDQSISRHKIVEASKDIILAGEMIQASVNMEALQPTSASVAVEIGGDKSDIHVNSASTSKLANGEPLLNPDQPEKQSRQCRKSCELGTASEKCKDADGLSDSSHGGVTDFNVAEKPSSATAPGCSPNDNGLDNSSEVPAEILKVKLADVPKATQYVDAAGISSNPEGPNLETCQRKKKTSRTQKSLSGRHGKFDTSSATNEISSDVRKLVEESLLPCELKSRCPHPVSIDKFEKSEDVLLAAETIGGSQNVLDVAHTMMDSVSIEKDGNSSVVQAKSIETIELVDQRAELQKNATKTKKKKKNSRKHEYEGTNQEKLPNIVMTFAINSRVAEVSNPTIVPDLLPDGNKPLRIRDSPAETLNGEHPIGKSTGTHHVQELADLYQNPEETHLEDPPHKHRRKSSNHQKKVSNHGKIDATSAATENVNNSKMAPEESAALTDREDKKRQGKGQDRKKRKATNLNHVEFENESSLGIQIPQQNLETDFDSSTLANTDLLGEVGPSHRKESGISPLLDKTSIEDDKTGSSVMLDNSAALPELTQKKHWRKKKKTENMKETNANFCELEKGSFFEVEGARLDLDNNFNNDLDSIPMNAHVEVPVGFSGSHDKQSDDLSKKTPDAPHVDALNCSSTHLEKSAVSSVAKDKKRKSRKSEKSKGQNVNNIELETVSHIENQGTEKILEANYSNEGLDGNACTDLHEKVIGLHDETSDARLSLDNTPTRDPPGEGRTDDCIEMRTSSIGKADFMEIFGAHELETSVALEENPTAEKSDTNKSPKEFHQTKRKSNAQKEDNSADTLGSHSQAKNRKKSRVEKLSNRKQNSDGSVIQEKLQEDDTERSPGISTANAELDTKPTPSNNGKKRGKSFKSNFDASLDLKSPTASGGLFEKAVPESEGYGSLYEEKDSGTNLDASTYPDQTQAGVTTHVKIAAPSLSNASSEDNSPNSTSCYRIAVRENNLKTSGKASRTTGQDEGFSARDLFSNNSKNATSEHEHGADNSSARKDPHRSRSMANLGSEQEIQLPNAQVIDYRDSSAAKDFNVKKRSATTSTGSRSKEGRFKLDAILRNTRTYKKASEMLASQSQEYDSECPDLVPESQF